MYDYIIVGAGISGLSVAKKLAVDLDQKVLVLEHEDVIGGRQNIIKSAGYNLLEQLSEIRTHQNIEIKFGNYVELIKPNYVEARTTKGYIEYSGKKIIVANGAIEKSAHFLKLKGKRLSGMYTFNCAMNYVNDGYDIGQKVVIIGDEMYLKELKDTFKSKIVKVFKESDEIELLGDTSVKHAKSKDELIDCDCVITNATMISNHKIRGIKKADFFIGMADKCFAQESEYLEDLKMTLDKIK